MGSAVWSIISYFILILFFVFSTIEHRLHNRSHLIIMVTLIVIAILPLPFRGLGLDFNNYKDFYNFPATYKSEPGYELVMDAFRSIGASFEFFYISIYAATIGLFFYAFNKEGNSLKLWFIFLALYYFTYFDVTRAFIASAFLLLSLRFFSDRRFVLCFFALGIGATFHYSLLLAIPLFFLLSIRISRIVYLFLIVVAVFLGEIVKGLLFVLYETAVFYDTTLHFLHDGIRYNYTGASEKEGYLNSIHMFLWYSITLHIPVISFVFSLLVPPSKVNKYTQSKYFCYLSVLNCFGICLFAFFYSLGSIVMAARVSQLLSIGLPVLVIIYCFGGNINNKKLSINWRYVLVCWLLILSCLLSFGYVAKVHQPGAMLYYEKIL